MRVRPNLLAAWPNGRRLVVSRPNGNSDMENRTRRVRHNSRRRTLAVLEKRHVTPRMLRIVLGGDDFEDFTTPSADDHIKLYVPGERAISKLVISPRDTSMPKPKS